SRLRFMIGEKLNISPKSVHAYIIGEHGDSEFAPFSNATIGLQNIHNFLNDDELNKIYHNVKNAAYEIINRKKATYYGIGMCLVRITNAILNNENSIITVSSYDKENDIFMGIPSIINRNGVRERVYVELNEEETKKLQNCVNIIKDAINTIK
ncbi:MAG: L-lactate dehydrogenase, partial [Turicibacter sp.]